MPVYCLEGVGGSGKSLYMLEQFIVPWLKKGKPIYHNIEGLKVPFVALYAGVPVGTAEALITKIGQIYEDVDGELVEKEDLEAIRHFYVDLAGGEIRPAGSLILIDEAQNYFNSRDFKNDYSRELVDYLSRNRHYKHTIVWATQNVEGVDITFRRQTQYIYWLERVGDKQCSSCKVYEGWMKNEWTKPYSTTTFRFNSGLFGCYQSYIKGSEGEEEHREKHNRWLTNKPFMVVICLFIFFVILAVVRGNPLSHFGNKKNISSAVQPIEQPINQNKPITTAFLPHESATPPDPSKGLAPKDGAGVAYCWRKSYVFDGVQYLVLNNGKTIFFNSEVEECIE